MSRARHVGRGAESSKTTRCGAPCRSRRSRRRLSAPPSSLAVVTSVRPLSTVVWRFVARPESSAMIWARPASSGRPANALRTLSSDACTLSRNASTAALASSPSVVSGALRRADPRRASSSRRDLLDRPLDVGARSAWLGEGVGRVGDDRLDLRPPGCDARAHILGPGLSSAVLPPPPPQPAATSSEHD